MNVDVSSEQRGYTSSTAIHLTEPFRAPESERHFEEVRFSKREERPKSDRQAIPSSSTSTFA